MRFHRSVIYRLSPGQAIPDDVATVAPAGLQPPAVAAPLPWQRGLLWLLFLGPFFFASYGFANWWAGSHADPGVLAWDWERRIPFLPWTIVPYWSIDLLYGLSFFLCRDCRETDRHALRLLTAQLVAVACFIAFPLRFSFQRPATDGVFGALFDALTAFDAPFNQAPSLHIALLVILWARYGDRAAGPWRLLVHAWGALIALSVLTTWQHHFIDLPTGVLLGAFCLWLWPDRLDPPLARLRLTASRRRRRIAAAYLHGALAFAGGAALGGAALWLLWPAAALALVGGIYGYIGGDGFQKEDGRLSPGATLLLAPYLAGAWINSRLWTFRHRRADEIMDGVWLGRLPTQGEAERAGFAAILDLAAELPAPRGDWHYVHLPWLDLEAPDWEQLATAAYHIARLRRKGPLLVCCALGYSRSAAAVAGWLLATGRAAGVEDAIARVSGRRPGVVLGRAHRASLAALLGPRVSGG